MCIRDSSRRWVRVWFKVVFWTKVYFGCYIWTKWLNVSVILTRGWLGFLRSSVRRYFWLDDCTLRSWFNHFLGRVCVILTWCRVLIRLKFVLRTKVYFCLDIRPKHWYFWTCSWSDHWCFSNSLRLSHFSKRQRLIDRLFCWMYSSLNCFCQHYI